MQVVVGTYNNDDVIGQDKFLSKKNFKNNLTFKMFQFPPLFILVMLSNNGSTHLDFLSKTIQNKHYFLSTILTSIIFKYSISCFRGRLERERGVNSLSPVFQAAITNFQQQSGRLGLRAPKLLSVISEMTFGPTKNDDDGRESTSLFSLLCCCCCSIAL